MKKCNISKKELFDVLIDQSWLLLREYSESSNCQRIIQFPSVVDGIGGNVKRMVYQDVMSGKRCTNANDFTRLIQARNTPIIIEELLTADIEDAVENLQLLFENVKAVPNIQKLHSVTVLKTNEIECKLYSNSNEKTAVHF